MLRSSRMIVWWSPVASYYLALHAAAVWRRYRLPERNLRVAAGPGWTFLAAVAIGGAAACSPLGVLLLQGRRPDPFESLSPQTPLGATDYLNAHPPDGQIFNTYEWGDYLLWAGPRGCAFFVASHAHLIPVPVWQDYIRVITLKSGWERILDRYGVSVAVLDAGQHAQLVDALCGKADWSVAYEDDRSAVFVRAQRFAWPMGGQKKSSGPLQQ